MKRNQPADVPAALAALDRARERGLDSAELHHHLAVALLQSKRWADAIDACNLAIERKSDYASAYHHLGVALRATGKTAEARRALEKAIELDPAMPRPWHGLGTIEAEAGNLDAAIGHFRRALELKPDYSAASGALMRLLEHAGRTDEARRVWDELTRRLVARSRARVPAEPVTGSVSVSDAIANLEGKLTPEGKAAQMHYALATLLNVFPPSQSPASGVTKLFDNYADRFDAHLEGKLDYRVPGMLAQAVAETKPAQPLDVLDLGCGTGLCGAALRPLARYLHGVDLSAAMIAKSTERGVYDQLTQGDIVAVLRQCSANSLDLIVATDVFIYVGDLAPAFESAADALRPRGLLAFSVEAAAGDRYHLLPTRRFAHAEPYLRHLAQIYGFTVERFDTIPVRIEARKHLAGYLVLLRM